ncbi:hypothetical protein AAII07_36535, partial [Microvirga sp. 0TCS3.31]
DRLILHGRALPRRSNRLAQALTGRSVIQPADQQRLSYVVSISAGGPVHDRADWQYDFERWCRVHGRVVERKRPNRSGTTRIASFEGTPALVAFIVDWIGPEWLERAMQGSVSIQAPTDVSALFVQLQELLSLTHKIDARTRIADFRFWAAARATLGLDLPSTELKTGNWDHLFEQDQTNAVRK